MEDAIELLTTDQQTNLRRTQILPALQELISTATSQHPDFETGAIAAVQKSIRDLEYFFKNILEYSTDTQPSYLAVDLIRYPLPSSRRLENLEELWEELDGSVLSGPQHFV